MTDLRKAAERVLKNYDEAPFTVQTDFFGQEDFEALRQALSNQFNPDWNQVEALQESLREHMAEIQRLRQALAQPDSNCNGMPAYEGPLSKSQALLQPEQEPVAWREVAGRTTKYYDYNEDGKGEPLYTKPPKWQRLTDDEIKEVYVKRGVTLTFNDFARAIEAKLKEKNCG